MRTCRSLIVLAFVGACSEGARPAPTAGVPNFQLTCDSADTAKASKLFCVRTDTRTGDVVVVNHEALPVSNGSTKAGEGPAGRFSTVCHSTRTDTDSQFYCLRLNVDTGEMLMVNLQAVETIPGVVPRVTSPSIAVPQSQPPPPSTTPPPVPAPVPASPPR